MVVQIMSLLVLYPVLQGLGLLVFVFAWTVYTVNLASLCDQQVQEFNAEVTSFSVSLCEILYMFFARKELSKSKTDVTESGGRLSTRLCCFFP